MTVAALITWVITALGGLYLLAIWLIEYDPDFQHAAATRLPVPVVAGHVLFAAGGLLALVIYAITDKKMFSLAAVAAAGLAAALGLTLAARWIAVYQAGPPRAWPSPGDRRPGRSRGTHGPVRPGPVSWPFRPSGTFPSPPSSPSPRSSSSSCPSWAPTGAEPGHPPAEAPWQTPTRHVACIDDNPRLLPPAN